MNQALFYCTLIALFWGGAPLVMRLTQVGPWMMGLFIAIGTTIVALPLIFTQNILALSAKTLAIGITAGILNGLGVLCFYKLLAGSNQGLWEFSRIAPIPLILMTIVIAIGGRLFFGETFGSDKMIGLGLAAGAIWFLS